MKCGDPVDKWTKGSAEYWVFIDPNKWSPYEGTAYRLKFQKGKLIGVYCLGKCNINPNNENED